MPHINGSAVHHNQPHDLPNRLHLSRPDRLSLRHQDPKCLPPTGCRHRHLQVSRQSQHGVSRLRLQVCGEAVAEDWPAYHFGVETLREAVYGLGEVQYALDAFERCSWCRDVGRADVGK